MTFKEKADLAGFLFVGFGFITAGLGIASWWLGKQYADAADNQIRQLDLAVETQRERAAVAESSLIELRERTRQRSFTPEEKKHLISSLEPFRGKGWFETWAKVVDPEANAFAEQLLDVFQGYSGGRQMSILPDNDAPNGVTIRVHSTHKLPEYAARFVQAAGEIGLHVAVEDDPQDQRLLDSTRVLVIVGSKPPLAGGPASPE